MRWNFMPLGKEYPLHMPFGKGSGQEPRLISSATYTVPSSLQGLLLLWQASLVWIWSRQLPPPAASAAPAANPADSRPPCLHQCWAASPGSKHILTVTAIRTEYQHNWTAACNCCNPALSGKQGSISKHQQYWRTKLQYQYLFMFWMPILKNFLH